VYICGYPEWKNGHPACRNLCHLSPVVLLWNTYWGKVLRPTRHKIGHFGDVPQANLFTWFGKTKSDNNKSTHSPIKRNAPQQNINTKQLKPGLVASYDIRPGNGEGLFLCRCFINLSFTYLLRHLPTYNPGTHTGLFQNKWRKTKGELDNQVHLKNEN